GKRRLDAEAFEQIEETPAADPHAVFVEGPMHDVGHELNSRWGREQLPRHRLADVPDLEIDSGPEYNAGIARQFERRAVHGRPGDGPVPPDHPPCHSSFPFFRHPPRCATL